MLLVTTKWETKVEEKKEKFLCPVSWCVHHNLAHDGYIDFACCCVQAKFLGRETKILFTLLWIIQRYLKVVPNEKGEAVGDVPTIIC